MKNQKEKLKKQSHFLLPQQQQQKIPRNKPTQGDKRAIYRKLFKTLKEIKNNINTLRDVLCSWVGRINTMKITILPKAIYRFNATLIKSPMAFFTKLKQ